MSSTTIARRELSSLSREKTIVLALLIQLVIAGFSSFLVVGLTSMYDPGAVDGEAIEVGIAGETQDALIEAAAESDDVGHETFDSTADAMAAFEAGDVDAVVTGTPLTDDQGTRLAVRAVAPAEDFRTTLIVVTLREYLSAVESAERDARSEFLTSEPLPAPEEGEGGDFFGFTYTILLPLLLFLPPFISGSLAVDSMTEELERGTLSLLRVAPLSLPEIVDGKALAMVALAPAQALLWIGLLRFNGFAISNVLALTAFVTGITLVTVAIGMTLALAIGARRGSQLLYSVLVLALFGLAVVLPEHPASTVALLAVDSATPVTTLHVVGVGVLGVACYALLREYAGRIPTDRLT